MASSSTDRWNALDFGPPPESGEEPDDPVLVDYVSDGAIAVITQSVTGDCGRVSGTIASSGLTRIAVHAGRKLATTAARTDPMAAKATR